MVNATEYFALGTLAENALPVAFSASCYHFAEDIRVLSVIVPKGKLCQVERQIVFAHLVERAHDSALQKTPKAIKVLGVYVAANVFATQMAYRVMGIALVESAVPLPFVSGNQRDVIRHGLLDKT
jgi:hypothetical protein